MEDIEVRADRRWVFLCLGVLIALVCMYMYDTQDLVMTNIDTRYTRLNRLYRSGLLFAFQKEQAVLHC